jgi:hypothetical protein
MRVLSLLIPLLMVLAVDAVGFPTAAPAHGAATPARRLWAALRRSRRKLCERPRRGVCKPSRKRPFVAPICFTSVTRSIVVSPIASAVRSMLRETILVRERFLTHFSHLLPAPR